MKNLATTIILILGVFTISLNSKAADRLVNENPQISSEYNKRVNQNAWHTFKEVVNSYYISTGKFQNLSKEEQSEFLTAVETMKARILSHNNEFATEKLKKIDLAKNIFKFVWEEKTAPLEIDMNIEIPPVPVMS
jgi:hypothetical protein